MLAWMHLPYPSPDLTDGVVRLRRWELGDGECVRLAATDARIPQYTSVPKMYSRAEGTAFIERQWSRHTTGEGLSLAVEQAKGRVAVGLIVALFRPQADVVGLGFWVVPPERRRGYTTRAVALLARWLLSETTVARVEALVEPANLPSRRVLERCGFQEEGCLRSYLDGQRDAIISSLLRTDLSV
jgi:[ribosomal protein S5]-alanine N-acetyltransferase